MEKIDEENIRAIKIVVGRATSEWDNFVEKYPDWHKRGYDWLGEAVTATRKSNHKNLVTMTNTKKLAQSKEGDIINLDNLGVRAWDGWQSPYIATLQGTYEVLGKKNISEGIELKSGISSGNRAPIYEYGGVAFFLRPTIRFKNELSKYDYNDIEHYIYEEFSKNPNSTEEKIAKKLSAPGYFYEGCFKEKYDWFLEKVNALGVQKTHKDKEPALKISGKTSKTYKYD